MLTLTNNPTKPSAPLVGELQAPECTTCYLGDIHGAYERVAELCFEHRDLIIIQVGDFNYGMKYFDHAVWELLLRETNSYLIALRGNHDVPHAFCGIPKDCTRMAFVPDYTTMAINGVNHLFVGGAHSIDRLELKRDRPHMWHATEPVKPIDYDVLKKLKTIDVLCTHTTPANIPPHTHNAFVMEKSIRDLSLLDDLVSERQVLQELLDALKPRGLRNHYYGHFHKSYISEFDNVTHRCLAIDEVYAHPNTYKNNNASDETR